MSRLFGRRRGVKLLVGLAVALVALVALAAACGALAYFTSTGGGSGHATAGTTAQVTISAGVTPTAKLYPGGSGDVTVSIDNPNTIAVHLPTLELDMSQGGGTGFAVDTAHVLTGCTAASAALSYTTQTNGGSGFVVAAKVEGTDGSLSADLSNAISMGVSSANACQGATVTVYLKVDP
jgi:hypothetical protein